MQGQQVLGGRYKLLNELGSGGMAVVWRARDEVLGRPVAVKFLDGRYAHDPYSRSRIRDEARAAANLSPHPHIAQVYDFGESQTGGAPIPYVVMELVNGTTLQQRLAAGPLAPRTVFRICSEVASALAAAHADGLVHRDIKPANVMVTATGAKVVDFGLAAAAGPGEPEEVVLGTPAYLAPERLTNDVVEPASDVYALGVLLYRLLAGKSPWSVDSTTQMLSAHVYIEPAPMTPLPGVPARIVDQINRCLRKYPADRPTAAEVSATLAGAAEDSHDDMPYPEPGGALVQRGVLTASWFDDDDETPFSEPGDPEPVGVEVNGPSRPPGSDVVPVRRPGIVLDRRPHRRRRILLLAAAGAVIIAATATMIWLFSPDPAESANAGRTLPAGVPTMTTGTSPGPGPARSSGPKNAGTNGPGSGSPQSTTVGGGGGTPAPPPTGPTPGTAPTTPTGTPSTTAPTAPPTGGHTKTLTSAGGSVVAKCGRLGRARLLSWTPAPSYTVSRIYSGPALTAFIVFETTSGKVRINVTCVAGEPTAQVVNK